MIERLIKYGTPLILLTITIGPLTFWLDEFMAACRAYELWFMPFVAIVLIADAAYIINRRQLNQYADGVQRKRNNRPL